MTAAAEQDAPLWPALARVQPLVSHLLRTSSEGLQPRIDAAVLVLLQFIRDDEPISMAELARRTRRDRSLVSRQASSAAAEGLVVKTSSSDRSRTVVVSLTPQGHKLLQAVADRAASRLQSEPGHLHEVGARADQLGQALRSLLE